MMSRAVKELSQSFVMKPLLDYSVIVGRMNRKDKCDDYI